MPKIKTCVMAKIAGINEQARENADAVAKMNTGIREIVAGIEDKVKEFDTYVKEFYYG